VLKMDRVLPEYASDPEDENTEGEVKVKRKHIFETIIECDNLPEAQTFLKSKGYAYDYRVKADPKNNRNVRLSLYFHDFCLSTFSEITRTPHKCKTDFFS
jgi:hypothetical protein